MTLKEIKIINGFIGRKYLLTDKSMSFSRSEENGTNKLYIGRKKCM